MQNVAGAVLAAGAGRRLGEPKGTFVLDGERLVDRVVAALRDGGCAPLYAVVRAGVSVPGAVAVVNPSPERGQRSSLSLAVDAAGAEAALAVVLVDVPGLTAAAVRAVIAAWRPGRIAVARAGDRRTHPIVMAPALWREALELAGPDEGARALLRARADLVDDVPVDVDPADLDTPADVQAWRARRRGGAAARDRAASGPDRFAPDHDRFRRMRATRGEQSGPPPEAVGGFFGDC